MLGDCQLLQTGIMQLCDQWQDRFIDLMRDLVTKRLNAIYQFMQESESALSVVPGNVQELRSALAMHADTAQRVPEIEKTFANAQPRPHRYPSLVPHEQVFMKYMDKLVVMFIW